MCASACADDHDGENSSPRLGLEIAEATGNVVPLFSREENRDVCALEDAGELPVECEAGKGGSV